MINNYLDWVKRRRKWYVQSAVRHEREFRDAGDDWTLGFNKGLAMAYDCAGLDFKRLQKDIEARNDAGSCVAEVNRYCGPEYIKLS